MGAEVPLADPAWPGADPAPGGLLDRRFDARGLPPLRAVVLAYAVEAGMPENHAKDVMLAAHELAANAVRHGAGAGRLQMRAEAGMLRVQVHDAGPASQNVQAGTAGLDGQDVSGGGADGGWPRRPGHGLWVVRQVADQVSVWRGPGGSVVSAALRCPLRGHRPRRPAGVNSQAVNAPVGGDPSGVRGAGVGRSTGGRGAGVDADDSAQVAAAVRRRWPVRARRS
jgi:anti-sigma regulatory factor (Ser/Thr protein kinase)